MHTINELLDMAKKNNQEISSDRKLAIALRTTCITRYRKCEDTPNDATATRLAELCNLSPEEVIATCHAAKAETPETKRAWKNLYKMAVNACVVIAVTWTLQFTPNTYKYSSLRIST